ncbi:MAG: FtsX-like permease family protein [Ilumatobacter sp.]|uniref:ABC transporter permease n=1 Tax=Ilumatobacter sp. TaxID=1967498 RepID=UPI00329851B8
MFQIAIRGLKQNPFRYVATTIAIVLGVAFYVATSVMTTSFEDTLNGSIAEAFDDVDGAVRSTEVIETDFAEIRQKIPYDTGERVAAIDGVERAGAFLTGYAQAVTADGDVVDSAGLPPQGFAWPDDTELSPYAIVDGAAPVDVDDVALDEDTFADGGFAIGDRIRVLPLPATQAFTVVGVVGPNGDGDGLGGQTVAFSIDGAAQVFGTTDVDQIFVQADDGLSQDELAASIDDALRSDGVSGLEAITGDELVGEYEDTIGQVTTIINAALQVFASIALVVGAFVIYNTFSITVAQRRREMALLRAIGASTKQVTRSIIVESLLIGVGASAVGALVGVGLGWVLLQGLGTLGSGFDIALTIPPQTLVAGVLIGSINTVFAAYTPARRGASIAPIEALRESSIEQPARSKWRTVIGVLLLVVGVTMSISAVTGADLAALTVGLPATVLAIVLLGPAIIRPMSRLIALPMVRNGSITGELARENAARNPKRTSTTSLTLVIGVALVVTATVFAATMSTSTKGQLEQQITADHVVTVGPEIALLGGGLDPTITPSIDELPGVDAAVPFRQASVEILDGFNQVTGTDTGQLEQVLDLNVVDGSVTGLESDEIAVSEAQAERDGLTVGDEVEVRFQQQAAVMVVAGVYERDDFVGSWLVDNAVLDANVTRSLDTEVLISSRGDAGDSVTAAVAEVLASNPTADIETTASFIDGEVGQIDQLLILLYGLLAMSVLVALIGIVNTMALSIHERTRELGLLRAVGMTSRQLRRTIRYESTIIALIGTVVGLGLGLFLGWVASRAAQDTFPDFAIPVISLIVIAVVGIVAGLAAGVLPARRAGKLDVLDAVTGD